jgi:hypothetical protein
LSGPIDPVKLGQGELRIGGLSIMIDSHLTLEEVNDPAVIARVRAVDGQAERNSDWLEAHWAEILPGAVGKHLVVAGQEAFIADTSAEAWALAKSAHPNDEGALCQYVLPNRGPRIYAHYWQVAAV